MNTIRKLQQRVAEATGKVLLISLNLQDRFFMPVRLDTSEVAFFRGLAACQQIRNPNFHRWRWPRCWMES
jgi:hypothetical protein